MTQKQETYLHQEETTEHIKYKTIHTMKYYIITKITSKYRNEHSKIFRTNVE